MIAYIYGSRDNSSVVWMSIILILGLNVGVGESFARLNGKDNKANYVHECGMAILLLII